MTVGDLIDAIKRIEELEAELAQVLSNKEDYLLVDQKTDQLRNLIGIYRSEQLDGDEQE